ncbi:hypothetical protein AGMMS49579_00490 [Spirochaetia bacterium]|nr:hypothetical protein AGMMS49579_00400 [Spirochaetia bacterium]GHV49299.1 hypothetical protein AGMMS49579_00490 [Spirochaetia bacterium]
MKNRILSGGGAALLGLLIAFGPLFIFKPCGTEDSFSHCHWSIQGDMGIGVIIAALGICLIVFSDPRTRFGLTIGIFFMGIVALLIPNWLIGGCSMMTMRCHKYAFPALTVYGILVVVGSLANLYYLDGKTKKAEG